jgi:hypothetical protein
LLRGALTGLGVMTVLVLTGCQFPQWGSPLTPSATPSTTPTGSAGATATESPSPTASSAPSAVSKATGSLVFFQMAVSKKLVGVCSRNSNLSVTLSDPKNDFYESLDLAVLLDPAQNQVISVTGDLGADSEGFTWHLSYDSTAPAAGTSATLTGSDRGYTITGVLASAQTRHGKTTTQDLPFTLKLACQAA